MSWSLKSWRDAGGRQADLVRLLRAVDVHAVDERLGREAGGALLGRNEGGDPIEAGVVAIAAVGDRILTSDPEDVSASSRRPNEPFSSFLLTQAAAAKAGGSGLS